MITQKHYIFCFSLVNSILVYRTVKRPAKHMHGSLVPRPLSAFQCCTLSLKGLGEPGDEAMCLVCECFNCSLSVLIIGGVKCSTEFHFKGYQCSKDSALQVCHFSYMGHYCIPHSHSSGLYPQLALPDDCNSYRRDSEQVFHTKVKHPHVLSERIPPSLQ